MKLLTTLLATLVATSFAGEFDDPHFQFGRETIVHLFEWPWDAIAQECESFLSTYAYAGVQVSPPQEHVVRNIGGTVPWYVRYQTVSYQINGRSGNEGQFRSMCDRCNRAGVRIYVDLIINHMTGNQESGTGSSGSGFDGGSLSYPAVPYGPNDFHPYCDIDFGNAGSIHYCWLLGLTDLNTESDYVQQKLADYMNHLIDAGAAGFRVDAAKHVPAGSLANIYRRLRNIRGDAGGGRPFIFNEVIDYNDQPVGARGIDYIGVGRVTNFLYGRLVTDAVRRSNNFQFFTNFGEDFGMLSRFEVVNFIDNHDTQREGCSEGGCGGQHMLTYKDSYSYTMAVTFMLAHDYGIPRVMSGYSFGNREHGPPSRGDYETIYPEFESPRGICRYSTGWRCEHRFPEIKNMARFRAACSGEQIQIEGTDDHRLAFRRGNKGFFIVNNNGDARWEGNFYTGLPAGRYCDVIDGDISDDHNTCTDYDLNPVGGFVTVGGDGRAQVSVQQGKTFAISLASKLN